ncbi:hypothetical protein GCM10010464_72440 [Pseudonocardia yunnanensis]
MLLLQMRQEDGRLGVVVSGLSPLPDPVGCNNSRMCRRAHKVLAADDLTARAVSRVGVSSRTDASRTFWWARGLRFVLGSDRPQSPGHPHIPSRVNDAA